jgi:UDP-2,3-diacylglucosamine pyrophosphatase LpxH
MSNDPLADTYSQLDVIWSRDEVPPKPIDGRMYVIISDLHLGNGGKADNFRHNRDIFMKATDHYLNQGYSLILAGDTEDLWQFDLSEVTRTYGDTVYRRLKQFDKANRLARIFGNHDREWGPIADPAFNNALRQGCPEAVKLAGAHHRPRVLIVHGHQGSPESDKAIWFSRFFVHLYRYVEPLTHSLSDDPAVTLSAISSGYERTMYGWAKANRVLLICGHSHRAVAASVSYTESLLRQKAGLQAQKETSASAARASISIQIDQIDAEIAHEKKRGRAFTPVEDTAPPIPCYFNTGCCCYKDGLTAIEIGADQIALVKWSAQRDPLRSMPLGECLTAIAS